MTTIVYTYHNIILNLSTKLRFLTFRYQMVAFHGNWFLLLLNKTKFL